MKNIISLNPFQCRMWNMHDRLDTITEQSCAAEIESFIRHGQIVPALGRPLKDDPTHKTELIYGARRLFVARHLNVPLLVEVRDLSDREAIVAMDIENRHRKDISPYERGLSYAQWLRAGHFRSQDHIAQALRVSASQVSRLLKVAQVPPVIIQAFGNPAVICEDWGLDIMQLLEDPGRREGTIRMARNIARLTPRPRARDIYRMLMSPVANGRRLKSQAHDEVVKDWGGRPLFRIRQQSSSLAFVVPIDKVQPSIREELRREVARILQDTVRTSGSPLGALAFKDDATRETSA